jgi:hypothetical protein
MFTAVNEAARSLSPLTTAVSVGVFKSIQAVLDAVASLRNQDEKSIQNLAYTLKLEYPFETNEYIESLARDMYAESKNA